MSNVNRRLLLAAAAAAFLSAGTAIAAEPVKIGMVMPFSGPAAAYGLEARSQSKKRWRNFLNSLLRSRGFRFRRKLEASSPPTTI